MHSKHRLSASALVGAILSVAIATSVFAVGTLPQITPVNLKVNNAVRDIGTVDATLTGNKMQATFTLSKPNVSLTNCCEFWWLQVVTNLVADAGNPKYKNAALTIPIIDTPNGGYDGQVGEDDQPWYLTPTDITNNGLNGTNPNGSMFFTTNDTPSVKGAMFDTWLVAKTAAKSFNVIAGFEWGSGTLGGDATIKQKNGNGVPSAANITTITNALTNGGFVGWTATMGANINCVPEPATWQLLAVAVCIFAVMQRRKAK